MKKTINFLILCFFCFVLFNIFIHNYFVKETIFLAVNIWLNKLVPNLMPLFLISPFLLNYGFAYYISIPFKKIFKILFNCNEIGVYVFFLSMISGFPSSAKYITDLYENNLIDENTATKLLTFTHFTNPLFILGFIKAIVGLKWALIILITHYSTNIIIGLIFRNMSPYIDKKINVESKSFSIILKEAIDKTYTTLITILETIIFFMIIIKIIKLPPIFAYFSNMFLEMTNGILYVSNLNTVFKPLFITMIISFGGICVHFQVLSIISNTKIKYQPYLLARLLHALIAGIIIYIINILV